jgi:hypothetical protein
MPLPWKQLEEDGVSGIHALIERKRLPPGVDALRQSSKWTEGERRHWRDHIWRGQTGSLPDDEIFQFLQPRPGQFDHTLRTEVHPQAVLHYPPESLAYARWLSSSPDQETRPERSDGLPPFTPNGAYVPVTTDRVAGYAERIGYEDPTCRLLELLIEYEASGPHQASLSPVDR